MNKKFQQFGWVMSKDRHHDICPRCIGVKPENKLAKLFKVSNGGQPVPTPAECADEAARAREAELAKTALIVARHMAPKAAASPAPVTPKPAPPPPPPDPRVGVLEREISELRAANELQLETSEAILTESRRTNEMLQISLQQNAQMIEAVARMASSTGRQNEALLSSVGQAANALSRLMDMAQERAAAPAFIEHKALPKPRSRRAAPTSRLWSRVDAKRADQPAKPPVPEHVKEWLAADRARKIAERRRPTMIAAE